MTIPVPTPEDLEYLRILLKDQGPFINMFADDIFHLVAMRDSTDEVLLAAVHTLLRKIVAADRYMEIFQFIHGVAGLKKETGDETSQPPKVKRGDCVVVPSKQERTRRNSGGCLCNGGKGWCVRCYNT